MSDPNTTPGGEPRDDTVAADDQAHRDAVVDRANEALAEAEAARADVDASSGAGPAFPSVRERSYANASRTGQDGHLFGRQGPSGAGLASPNVRGRADESAPPEQPRRQLAGDAAD